MTWTEYPTNGFIDTYGNRFVKILFIEARQDRFLANYFPLLLFSFRRRKFCRRNLTEAIFRTNEFSNGKAPEFEIQNFNEDLSLQRSYP